jgi:2-haloacid dehalogenase
MLDVAPAELLMVAAHPSYLAAAKRAGLRTAYVPRPLEYGAGGGLRDAPGDLAFDHVATDFAALATQLGA